MTTIENVNDPWRALAVALLARAKLDAQRGDLGALAWLVVTGRDIADALADGAGCSVLAFARATLAAMDAGSVKTVWKI